MGTVGMVFSGPLGSVYAHACVLLVGIGYAGFQLLQFSMLSDVIVHDTLVTGKRRAGVFTGLWTAAETVVFAFGALILGWLLGATGFVESDPATPVAQPESATTAVLYGATLLPALLMVVSILLTMRYTLTAEKLREAGAGVTEAAETAETQAD
ncbi:MFS transporter [Streptosporangium sp. NPDC001682]